MCENKTQKTNWEDLAKIDPLWAILSVPQKKNNRWKVDEFFKTGEQEIAKIITKSNSMTLPKNQINALDFGCGVGRLTRALDKYFKNVYGVDISENMINMAEQHNKSEKKLKFIVNKKNDLSIFEDDKFDLIYSNIVLQHINKKEIIELFICEFIRILEKNGILIFQLPYYISKKYQIQPRRRIYKVLKLIGINESFLIKKLNLTPIIMNYLSEKRVSELIKKSNGKLIHIETNSYVNGGIKSHVYFISK